MASLIIVSGALLGAAGLIAGTFASHAVARVCRSPDQVRNWEAAIRAGLVHAIVMLVAGILLLTPRANDARGLLTAAGLLFLTGTLLFSVCLAAFAISGRAIFAAVAPLGSIVLLIGWAALACAGFLIH